MGLKPIIDIPCDTLIEISLIGTGGGYGESCVIHLGNQNWIIVDSCIDPETKSPLALEYLKEIGVDVESQVKLIICTHWHDDHILGLSKVLEVCKESKFSFAKTLDKDKFLRLLTHDNLKSKKEAFNTSTREFNNCLSIIEKRDVSITQAIQDRILFSNSINDHIKSEIISLSPSDYTIACFDSEISSLITEFGASNKKLQIKKPNAKSVALYLKLGSHRAILGADLEIGSHKEEGWINIIENSTSIDKKATLFKIPHHGSENGYHERIWLELLEQKPISKLTPWSLSSKLPQPEMLAKYLGHTDSLYMTSPILSDRPKKREKHVEKLLTQLKYKIKEVRYKKGIIRCRIDLLNALDTWTVDLIDSAIKVEL